MPFKTNIIRGKKIELLAPAGNFEKLEIAINYGADAVYLAGLDFSLRNFSGNFSMDELEKALCLARSKQVKVYVACNIYARNEEILKIEEYLLKLADLSPDAVIIADPGIFQMAQRILPPIPIHISTQANTTNYQTALFWHSLGASRINAARELSLIEIEKIAGFNELEVEAFVHGAMCISYSGRCLLSSFMAKRDSNRGMCCHPCRFNYAVMEAFRPDQYYPLAEDQRGTYIFNSRDLCMIEHLPAMIKSGLTSLKIEGRMKGIHYLASVLNVYRRAIDAYYHDPAGYQVNPAWIQELGQISHRGYCTGFYFNDPDQIIADFDKNQNTGNLFLGKILEPTQNRQVLCQVRNKIFKDDLIEILTPGQALKHDKINEIYNLDKEPLFFAQPGSLVKIVLDNLCKPNDLIRRR